MSRTQLRCGASTAAVFIATLTSYGNAFAAAEAASAGAPATVGEVVVTGSHIAGTPENSALPVTVLSSDTLMKQGSPSIVELIKDLPESSGVLGRVDEVDSQIG
jgi:iron complex outermembrane receptor protein